MRYVVGIDSDGTKSVGLLATRLKGCWPRHAAGGANLLIHGELAAEKGIKDLESPGPIEAICLGTTDGVLRACPSLYERVESNLDLPKAEVIRLDKEPATGAVTLALERFSG